MKKIYLLTKYQSRNQTIILIQCVYQQLFYYIMKNIIATIFFNELEESFQKVLRENAMNKFSISIIHQANESEVICCIISLIKKINTAASNLGLIVF